jgi:hypothetical protein
MTNPGAGIEEEITQIEKIIATDSEKYWKGPGSKEMQARYQELLSVREKIKQRA